MHLEAMGMGTWRMWSSKFGDALRGHDQMSQVESVDEYNLEAVDPDMVDQKVVDWEARQVLSLLSSVI